MTSEQRKEGRKEGRKGGRKEGRKEGEGTQSQCNDFVAALKQTYADSNDIQEML